MGAKKEFLRQWGVSGMPKDKQKLASEAFNDGLKAGWKEVEGEESPD